jgi:hypothetical protein
MANRTQIYSTTDWLVWTYVPEPGSFVLDFSKLNGTDVLGSYNGSMVTTQAEVTGIDLSEGSAVSNAIFTEVTPSTITISLSVENFTTSLANEFFVGTPIWVTYKNAETYPDANFGQNTPLFVGKIRSFAVDVQPGQDFSTVTIQATSNSEDDLNVLMTILKDNIVLKTSAITAAATALNIETSFYALLPLQFGGTAVGAYETKSYGEWVADLVLCNLDVVRDDITVDTVFWGATSRNYNYLEGIKTTSSRSALIPTRATLNETSITDVELNWDGAGAPTGVNLTNYYNPALVYQYGSTSSTSTGGAFNFAATVDLKDISQMTTVGQQMVSYGRTFAPVSVGTVIATNYQDITFVEDFLLDQGSTTRSAWLYPDNLLRIGEVAEFTLTEYGFTDYRAIVTGRTITVTPDHWTVTYNIWKGF